MDRESDTEEHDCDRDQRLQVKHFLAGEAWHPVEQLAHDDARVDVDPRQNVWESKGGEAVSEQEANDDVQSGSKETTFALIIHRDVSVSSLPESVRLVLLVAVNSNELNGSLQKSQGWHDNAQPVAQDEEVLTRKVSMKHFEDVD